MCRTKDCTEALLVGGGRVGTVRNFTVGGGIWEEGGRELTRNIDTL